MAVAREMGVVPRVVCPLSVVPAWEGAARLLGTQVEAFNYEKARSRKSPYGFEQPCGSGSRWVWNDPAEFIIFDEAHRCSGHTTLNSKMLIAAKRQCGTVLNLSATIASKPTQLKAVGYSLGLFEISEFKWWLLRHGCVPGVFGGFEFTDDPFEQDEAIRKIHQAIFPRRGARLRKEEIPGFPKTQIEVQLIPDASGKAAKLSQDLAVAYHDYEARARELKDLVQLKRKLAKENDEEFLNPHGLEIILRKRQALELLKVPVLVDLAVDDVESSKVCIFVNFTETVDALVEKLSRILGKEKVAFIDGRNVREREEIRVSFQRNEIDVLVVNSEAGKEGISLHDPTGKVERTTRISPCYRPDTIKQVLGRVQRDGGAFSRQFFHYFENTMEEDVAEVLQSKLHCLDTLNDAELNGAL
jgi:hypothetical protein